MPTGSVEHGAKDREHERHETRPSPYQLIPDGVRHVGTLLPLRWYQIGLRRIVARGGGLDDVLVPLLALTLFFAVVLALIRWRLRRRLA